MQYKVIMDDHLGDFQRRINMALDEGWELYGGLIYDGKSYHQAIIKYNRRY
jgi:hypothetical protein